MRNPFEVCHKCGQAVDKTRSYTMTGKGVEHQTCPVNSQGVDQARAALDQARADHAAALLAVRDQPGDADARRRFREAVQQGRGAWKGYQEAATAGLAAQISGIVPGDFMGNEQPGSQP